MVKSPPPAGSPFVELIDSYNSMGVLGPVVCAKLAHDFWAYREQAKAIGATSGSAIRVGGRFRDGSRKRHAAVCRHSDPDQMCRTCGLTDDKLRTYNGPLGNVP